MKAIIVGNNGRASMREVLRLLDNDIILFTKKDNNSWTRQSKTTTRTSCSEPTFSGSDIILKWGNSIPVSIGNATYYNRGFASNNASNKLEARLLFEENNIATPRTYATIDQVQGYPVVIRPIKHKAGKYFYIAHNRAELSRVINSKKSLVSGYYMSEIYAKTREFRLHCAFGKVLVMKEKPPPSDLSQVAWNFAINEEAWSTIDRQNYDTAMCKLALCAIDVVGLDIGAVDIMSYPSSRDNRLHVVCEINTAPSLTPYLAEKYSMLFNRIFSNKPIEKWNYQKLTKGQSMSWKNFQLMER